MSKYGKFSRDELKKRVNESSTDKIPNIKEIAPFYAHVIPPIEETVVLVGIHYLPVLSDDGKETVKRGYACLSDKKEGCPICQFLDSLKNSDEVQPDDVVVSIGKGRKSEDFTKDDLTGESSDFKKNIKVAESAILAYVDHKDAKVKKVSCNKSHINKILNLIDKQVEEGFEDPFEEPSWAIKFDYDAKAKTKSEIYSFTAATKKEATDEIIEAIESFDEDLTKCLRKPERQELNDWIQDNVDEEIKDILGIEPQDEDEKPAKKSSKKSKDEDDDEDEDEKPAKKSSLKSKLKSRAKVLKTKSRDEDDEDEKPAKKSSLKSKTSKKKESRVCPNCEEELDEEYDDETECPYCEASLEDDEDEDEKPSKKLLKRKK